jgi:hypothetical protein
LLVDLLRQRPELAVDLLRTALGVPVPRGAQVTLGQADLGAVPPVEARADVVLLLRRADRVVFALVVEVQLTRDPEKRRRWPLYAANVSARHRCPAAVLVVAPDRSVAIWAKRPISLAAHGRWVPLVLGPAEIPRAGAHPASPELALLSVRAHAHGEGGLDVARAALEAIIPLDPDQRDTYHDILMAWLPEALREELMMTAKSLYPQSDFAREHFGKGRAEGRVEGRVEGQVEALAAVLRRQLTLRFGHIPAPLEQRLHAADADTLLRWAERILTAATPDEVFDG